MAKNRRGPCRTAWRGKYLRRDGLMPPCYGFTYTRKEDLLAEARRRKRDGFRLMYIVKESLA